MEGLNRLKDLLENTIIKYEGTNEFVVPLDEEGRPLMEYVAYINLNNVHSILEQMSEEISSIIIDMNMEEGEATALVNTQFNIIPKSTLQEMNNIIGELATSFPSKGEPVTNEDDIDITA